MTWSEITSFQQFYELVAQRQIDPTLSLKFLAIHQRHAELFRDQFPTHQRFSFRHGFGTVDVDGVTHKTYVYVTFTPVGAKQYGISAILDDDEQVIEVREVDTDDTIHDTSGKLLN